MPACPRCGYDQSGQIASWKDECPLTGRCPECGLELIWARVLNPSLRPIRWFYEHEPWLFRALAALAVTLCWALTPWRFWKRVGLTHSPNVPRLLMVPLLLYLAAALVACVHTATFARYYVSTWEPLWISYVRPFLPMMLSFSTSPSGRVYVTFTPHQLSRASAALLAAGIAWPLTLLALATTLSRARIRWPHLLRAAVYSTSFSCLVMLLRTLSASLAMASFSAPGPNLLFRSSSAVESVLQTGWIDVLCGVWLAGWWWCTMVIGFRFRRGWLDWLLVCCVVATVAYAAWIANDVLQLMGNHRLWP